MSDTITNLTIKDWAEEDRPREKLIAKGRTSLTDAELIGILLGSGNRELSAVELARQILNHVENNLNELATLEVEDLRVFKGIGEAKAINIISALELGRRRKKLLVADKPKISSSVDVYNLMKPEMLDLRHEEFWIIILNRANTVLRKEFISRGGVTGTVVDPKIIFKKVLDYRGTGTILVHNHPSGNSKPSRPDINITKKIVSAGQLLEISVLDHIIFTDYQGHFSFADNNMI
ncbi:MAG: DNA repair protein RadC [Cyclobacteriaceae bacterium]